jgi:hypothetical protein
MPRIGGPSGPSRSDLERELADLVSKVRALDARLGNLPPAAKANAEAEITRLKSRMVEIRLKLGR